MPVVDRQPVVGQPVETLGERLPFGPDFQLSLFRLLMEDGVLAHALREHLEPSYFEAAPLAWAWGVCLRYHAQFDTMPTIRVIQDQVRGLDPRIRAVYAATIERVTIASLKEEDWLRHGILDFVRRNVFVRAFRAARDLYNAGKTEDAYDHMMAQMGRVQAALIEDIDREWVFEQLPQRQSGRLGAEGRGDATPTGLRWLDNILEGGLHAGELGLWIAYPKTGKTTLLVNHGVAAVRLGMKNTLHVVFEGSRRQVVNRYDAAFAEELYSHVKSGNIDHKRYELLLSEAQMFKHKLVVRAFVDRWDYSVLDVHEEIRSLQRDHNWCADVVIVDYGDLLRGREKNYHSETEKQRAAFRDLKSLANRGYAVWTASQARRPEKGSEGKVHLLRSRDIADAYDKVRVADYVGSINMTIAERQAKVGRLLAEYYRDNEAEQSTIVRIDFARMCVKEETGLTSPSVTGEASGTLGVLPYQTVAPI